MGFQRVTGSLPGSHTYVDVGPFVITLLTLPPREGVMTKSTPERRDDYELKHTDTVIVSVYRTLTKTQRSVYSSR